MGTKYHSFVSFAMCNSPHVACWPIPMSFLWSCSSGPNLIYPPCAKACFLQRRHFIGMLIPGWMTRQARLRPLWVWTFFLATCLLAFQHGHTVNRNFRVYRPLVLSLEGEMYSTVPSGKCPVSSSSHSPVFIKISVVINSPAVTNQSRDSSLYWLGQGSSRRATWWRAGQWQHARQHPRSLNIVCSGVEDLAEYG
jgi:hypothetical protein